MKHVYRSSHAARPAAPTTGRPVILGAAPGAWDEVPDPAALVTLSRAELAAEAALEAALDAAEAALEATLDASDAAEELR